MKSARDNILIALGEAQALRLTVAAIGSRVHVDAEARALVETAEKAIVALRNALARKAEV